MAKNIATVDTLTDTFNTWILRTNEVIATINSEALTANSTQGITGSSGSPVNARLFGTFTTTSLVANTLSVGLGGLVANSTAVLIGSVPVIANNSTGTAGQVLTSSGTGVYWAAAAGGGGGVTSLTAGNGIEFSPGGNITSTGTIGVKAADTTIVINSSGIAVNSSFLASVSTNATALQGRTWEAPGQIGLTLANTGNFTSVTTTAANGYRIAGDSNFIINNTTIRLSGLVDVTTPNSSTTGGLRLRGNGTSGLAYLQIVNTAGDTEWSNFRFNSAGAARYSNDFEVVGNLRFNGDAIHGGGPFSGTEVGYKTIPQIITNSNINPMDPEVSSGAHHYKTATSDVSVTFTTAATPIGTAITFVNDASSGNLILVQGTGVTLQLGGTLTAGTRTVGPGGVATALNVAANKWIVSGVGVS